MRFGPDGKHAVFHLIYYLIYYLIYWLIYWLIPTVFGGRIWIYRLTVKNTPIAYAGR